MIKEVVDAFKEVLNKNGERIIYDNKNLKKGTYVIVSADKKSYEMFNVKNGDDYGEIGYDEKVDLVEKESLSTLLNMNKPVDPKKTVHSNNYMSFFIKKNNMVSKEENDKREPKNQLKEHQLVLNSVDRYFDAIENMMPDRKSNKKADLEILSLYDSLKNPLEPVDKNMLEENKKWIKENILSLKEHENYEDDNNYLKIFFEDSKERYLNENTRYLAKVIFVSNKYNTIIDNAVCGISASGNMQMNEGKPSLRLMTRKNVCPSLLSLDEALLEYKLFAYLITFAELGEKVVYVDKEGFYRYEDIKNRKSKFSGYVLKLAVSKSTLNVEGFNIVMGYNPKKLERKFEFKNILNSKDIDDEKLCYGEKESLYEIYQLVDHFIFNNTLKKNMFNNSVKFTSSQHLTYLFEYLRPKMFDWFYCNKDREGYFALKRFILSILQDSITKDQTYKAQCQFNLLYSLVEYYEGNDFIMKMNDTRDSLVKKIQLHVDEKESQSLSCDEEYYYAIGQVAKFLLTLSNTGNWGKQKQLLINRILNSKNDMFVKSELIKLYKKYNYSQFMSSNCEALYGMIMRYEPKEVVDKTDKNAGILAGFLDVLMLKNPSSKSKKDEQDNQ